MVPIKLKKTLTFLKIYTLIIFTISLLIFLFIFPYLLIHLESIQLFIAYFDFNYLKEILGAIIIILIYSHLLATTKLLNINKITISIIYTDTLQKEIPKIEKLIIYLLITLPFTIIIVLGIYFLILIFTLGMEGLNLNDTYITYKNSSEILQIAKKSQIISAIITTFIITSLISININKNWIINLKKIISKNLENILNLEKIKIEYNYTYPDKEKTLFNSKLTYIKPEVLRVTNDLILINSNKAEEAISYINEEYTKWFEYNLGDEIILTRENFRVEVVEIELKDIYIKRYNKGYHKTKIKNFQGILIILNLSQFISTYIYTKEIILIYKSGFSIYNIQEKSKYFGKYLQNFETSAFKVDNDKIYLLYNTEEKEEINKFIDILTKIAEKFFKNENYKKSFIVYYKKILYLFIPQTISNSNKLLPIPFYLLANSKNLEKTISNFKLQIQEIVKLFF
ncbi:MAG: hypothetical protein ACP5O4_02435 [bacterium]